MATRIFMNNFVFYSQMKFIFGTIGKQKSINYLVVMKTLSCYSLGDVLICYIYSFGQQTSGIRKSPQEQVIWSEPHSDPVFLVSLFSSFTLSFSYDFWKAHSYLVPRAVMSFSCRTQPPVAVESLDEKGIMALGSRLS